MGAGKISTMVVVVFLLSFSMLPDSLQAKYSGGSGEPNDPYQIANTDDLLALAVETGDYVKHFLLTADIDLAPNLPGGQVFTTAIIAPDTSLNNGFQGTAFSGTFDGAGHKIINLTINTNGVGNNYLGLFGYLCVDGKIKNLGVENVFITGGSSHHVGGLVGENLGPVSDWSFNGHCCRKTG